MKTITTIALATLVQLNSQATPVTTRFDDIDRAPSDSLTFGPITIHAANGLQVATIAGVGLGVVGVGGDGSVSTIYHYSAGGNQPDFFGQEKIIFEGGDGVLRALPVRPVGSDVGVSAFTLAGAGDIHSYYFWEEDPIYSWFSSGTTYYSEVTTDPEAWWADTYFNPIRGGDVSEELTVQFGVSFLSMEFEAVPEPSTWMLLAGGVAAIALCRHRVKIRPAGNALPRS